MKLVRKKNARKKKLGFIDLLDFAIDFFELLIIPLRLLVQILGRLFSKVLDFWH